MKLIANSLAALLMTTSLVQSASLVYIGTYTGPKSKGIYAFRLDEKSGTLTPVGLAAETPSPSYLTLHPTGRYLYAANEVGNFGGQKSGSFTSFSIDPQTGMLKQLNAVASKGGSPCHMTVDKTGKMLVGANYSGENVVACPVKADGSLGEVASEDHHTATGGPVSGRQKQAHPHSFNVSPSNRFAIAADLGTDQMYVYKIDPAAAKITPNDPPSTKLKPGSGPRHFAFHPSHKFAYSINELASTLTVFAWDDQRGTLTEIQSETTLPAGFTGKSYTAEVVVHPNGKYVYGSNRGHDSIAVFAVDAKTGKLSFVEHVPTQGKTPRNFNIDPSGQWLIAANQDTDNIAVFRVNPSNGKLTFTGQSLPVGAPVCVKFLSGK